MVGRSKPSMDQLPLFEPNSDWIPPQNLPDLSQETEVAIDTETRDDSLANDKGPGFHLHEKNNDNTGFICGISVAWREYAIYIPLRHYETECFNKDLVRRWLKSTTMQTHTRFIFHNFQYDWGWLEAVFDIPPPANIDDTAAMASMINENLSSFSLDALCAWQGLPGKDETLLIEALSNYSVKSKNYKSNLWRLKGKHVGPYAEQDAASTLTLSNKLRPLLTEENLDYAYQIERDLMPMTLKMKQRGIRVDTNRAEQLSSKILTRCDEKLKSLSQSIGQRVTIKEIRSAKWLKAQFDDLGLHYPKTMPTENYAEGQASFEKGFMSTHHHWFPRMVYEIKHQTDLAERFLKKFILKYAHKGRVHPTVNQFRAEGGGARSHRFSYSDPPLQQMPSRDDEWAPLIRSCFLPEVGELWAGPDFNQQEYRLIVHMAELAKTSGSQAAADRYRNDPKTDFHDYVAEITRLIRRRAKDVNFAKAFGAGVPKFALMIGVSVDEAQQIYEQYDREMPFVKQTAEKYINFAINNGYIEMIDGARNHFNLLEPKYRDFAKEANFKRLYPDGETSPCFREEAVRRYNDNNHPWFMEKMRRSFTHKAFNRLIQGSAARQTKKAMVDIYKAGYLPLLQMHDELPHSFVNEKDGIAVCDYMINAVKLTVPVHVDIEWGINWGEAAKNKSTGYMATYAEAMRKLQNRPTSLQK